MKLTVHEFLSLDGVMQGPGAPDEDRSNGFDRGGWLVPHFDADTGAIVDSWFAATTELLLGATTYRMMQTYWSQVTDADNRVATVLNTFPKHLVTTTVEPSWDNTTVVTGDLVAAVSALKNSGDGELQVHGSARLARTLHDLGLIDEYRLIVFPTVVGAGKRLFGEGAAPADFELTDTRRTGSGATYVVLRPTGTLQAGAFTVADGHETVTD